MKCLRAFGSQRAKILKRTILSSIFAGLTAVGAFIKIPLPYPVPITFQVLFVFLAADLLGGGYACLSQIIYLLLGLVGLPVFAGGGGIGYILHPCFGYLLSFPIAGLIIGTLVERFDGTSIFKYLCYNCIGLGVIYLLGVSYLYLIKNVYLGMDLSLTKVIWIGALIFVPVDLIKALLASYLAIRLKKYGVLP